MTSSYWNFLGFSFEKLIPSNISSLVPVKLPAIILSYSETFCALIILVILVFSVLTAARDRYREDIDDFILELRELGSYLQNDFYKLYSIAVNDVEIILLASNAVMVNHVRKYKGLPSLSLPKEVESNSLDVSK